MKTYLLEKRKNKKKSNTIRVSKIKFYKAIR